MFRTDFLFARPSFIEGIASVLDLGATLIEYNESKTPEDADYIALKSDWGVIGNDIKNAIETFKDQHNDKEKK